MILDLLLAFLVGGAICAVAQLFMDLTPFSVSTSHILVALVVVGELLGFFGHLSGIGSFCRNGSLRSFVRLWKYNHRRSDERG